jgi:hypothetical protein
MPNNTVMRHIAVTAGYAPLSDARLVASVTVSAPPTNSAAVYFRGDDGSDVPWQPGEWHVLRSVDLSTIEVKGTPGDVVTVVGGSW